SPTAKNHLANSHSSKEICSKVGCSQPQELTRALIRDCADLEVQSVQQSVGKAPQKEKYRDHGAVFERFHALCLEHTSRSLHVHKTEIDCVVCGSCVGPIYSRLSLS